MMISVLVLLSCLVNTNTLKVKRTVDRNRSVLLKLYASGLNNPQRHVNAYENTPKVLNISTLLTFDYLMRLFSFAPQRLRAVQVLPNLVSKLDTRSRYGLL